jgi:hypothetical protein
MGVTGHLYGLKNAQIQSESNDRKKKNLQSAGNRTLLFQSSTLVTTPSELILLPQIAILQLSLIDYSYFVLTSSRQADDSR